MNKLITLVAFAGASLALNPAMAQCPSGQSEVVTSILTDNYGVETTWTLTGLGGSPLYGSGGPYANNTPYNVSDCVPNGPVMVFTIYDSFGDGVCCGFGQGNYSVTVGGTQIVAGGQFTTSETTVFVAGPQTALDLAPLSLTMNQVISQGNQSITGSLKNFGTSAVSSFTLNYSVDNGPTVSQNITANIAPGASYAYTHGTPWNATVGAHNVRVWTSSPNGQADNNALNDELTFDVNVATQSVQRKALMEQFTSSTCGPCASLENSWGNPVFSTFNPNTAGSNMAAIKYHLNFPSPGNDPSYNPDANTRRTYYGVNAIPGRFMNGTSFNTNTAAFLTNSMANQAFVNVEVAYTMTWSSITVNITVTPYATFTGNHRLYIAVAEDRYDYPASTTSQDVFKYVMRKMLPNASGILLANLTAGVPQTFTQSYTFPSGAPAQGNYNLWTNLDNSTVVAFVQNLSSKEVLQASFAPLVAPVGIEENNVLQGLTVFPNPANDALNMRFDLANAGTVYMELTNTLGQRVLMSGQNFGTGTQNTSLDISGVEAGIYVLTLTSADQRATRTISVIK